MKPVNIKSRTYIDFDKKNNKEEDATFRVGDHVIISKYKNIFAKGFIPNGLKKFLLLKKLKYTVPWTYIISDFKSEEIAGTFYEKD